MTNGNFFHRLSNELLEASNHIQTRFEEGLSVLLGEESSVGTEGGTKNGYSPGESNERTLADDFDLDLDGMDEQEVQRILEEEMMDHSPLEGIADSVIADIVSRQAGPSSPLEHFHAFRSAITWSEKFILCLVGFQISMFLLSLYVSRRSRGLTPRVCLMVVIAIIVRSSEWLNGLGAKHWQRFATQDYFDRRGIFTGIMVSFPLLLDSLMMLLFFLSEAAQLLVQVKTQELKRKKNGKVNAKATKTD